MARCHFNRRSKLFTTIITIISDMCGEHRYTSIALTTIVWWICSAYFNIYAKRSLSEYTSPDWSKTISYSLTLTLQQLFTASILYLVSSKIFQTKLTSSSKSSISLTWAQWFTITKVPAFCFATNALLSNTIISLSSITNFQMYKSLEPIFIVIVMFAFDPVTTWFLKKKKKFKTPNTPKSQFRRFEANGSRNRVPRFVVFDFSGTMSHNKIYCEH